MPTALGAACDIAVVLGGDGTMLGIARQLARHGTPLVGINQGRLGFITDIAFGGYEAALAAILDGEYDEEQRAMLEGHVERDGARIFEGFALNDVIVSRGATAGMVELKIEIDGDFVANLRADGLIVGSPTGSTAYALSAGGPILHPGIAGWVVVPIAPHDLSNRPIVVPDSGAVAIEIVAGRDASVNFDMQSLTSLAPRRPDPRAPLGAPCTLPASARLELLLDPAQASCTGPRERATERAVARCCIASRSATS